ncbi:hypothetical protein EYF80_054650 [Liparis tanakae]|uniref:Uncharacterized protein n=1 Tax=Liparis tanakae TaxID=230148 RepID=A0A4Z2F2B4_9TELE|nr:hypothetical protein EYF80_054650 [Liparis tanakae]
MAATVSVPSSHEAVNEKLNTGRGSVESAVVLLKKEASEEEAGSPQRLVSVEGGVGGGGRKEASEEEAGSPQRFVSVEGGVRGGRVSSGRHNTSPSPSSRSQT